MSEEQKAELRRLHPLWAAAIQRVGELQKERNEAQLRCYEAQQELHDIELEIMKVST